ncbi:type II secretion system protein GspM [Sandarakinorhabdus sp.]|uniref:type II secretion system protein GspM n=1 Tax=Sandarakinorhabdus sp. TaxID=1916663 RepID=UPI00286DD8F7|nr:type II secretion system protein GspM [Sandarakinorhabdus sp.]
MIAIVMPWWRARSRREQWLVGVMLALLAALLVWLVLLRPLASARAAAEARAGASVKALAEIRADAERIVLAQQRRAAQPSGPVIERVSARISTAGVAADQITAGGDGAVLVSIPAVRGPALLALVSALEQSDGLVIQQLTASRNADGTVTARLSIGAGR